MEGELGSKNRVSGLEAGGLESVVRRKQSNPVPESAATGEGSKRVRVFSQWNKQLRRDAIYLPSCTCSSSFTDIVLHEQ